MSKSLTESRLEELYQEYLKKGYYPEFARIKANYQVFGDSDLIKPITINIPGVGDCQYTGD